MNLTQRQQIIFKTIVEQFTLLAEPIGSKALIPLLDFQVSSATIRNEMAALEREGLLEKTHSSSGRIPSLFGYRYYITHLMDFNLSAEVENSLRQIFEERHYSIDELVEMSCSLLSEMTHLTSVALGPQTDEQHLVSVQLVPLSERSAVAILITDQGHTQSRVFTFSESLSLEDLQAGTEFLNQYLKGVGLNEVVSRLWEIKGIMASRLARHEVLFDAFVSAFMEIATSKSVIHGRFHILAQPEFSNASRLLELMKVLEDSSLFKAWMLQKTNVAIPIGTRNELIQIGDCSVVTSKFKCSQSEEGQLMVIGPNRMNYAQVIPLIDYISDIIERVFSEQGGEYGPRKI